MGTGSGVDPVKLARRASRSGRGVASPDLASDTTGKSLSAERGDVVEEDDGSGEEITRLVEMRSCDGTLGVLGWEPLCPRKGESRCWLVCGEGTVLGPPEGGGVLAADEGGVVARDDGT